MITMETNRLYIRNFNDEDWRDLHEYLSQKDVLKYEPGSVSDEADCKKKSSERSRGNAFWAVCLKENSKMIGHIYFDQTQPFEFSTWEIGYIFNPLYYGKGYATEACEQILHYGFTQLGAHRVIAGCSPENTASWKLLERLSMRKEGYFKKNAFFHKTIDGKPIWFDSFQYAILAEEWKCMKTIDLIIESDNMNDYLVATLIIDFENKDIQKIANEIISGETDQIEMIRLVYEFVRDKIAHSADIDGKIVTCNASEVLLNRQGICYAKAHLLAAILRYLKIPAGFCYQKLILNDDTKNWLILHGLNAVYVEKIGKWIRLDARGNKDGVDAQFNVDEEKLAFRVRTEKGEIDIPIVFTDPDEYVVQALKNNCTVEELFGRLPVRLKSDAD